MDRPKYTFKSNSVLYTHSRVQLSEDIIGLPNGKESTYLRYDKLKDSATLLVQNNKGKFLLLSEYTYPIDEYIYQMPGGVLEPKEEAIDAAKRELLEETGYIASNFELLGTVLQDHRRSLARLHMFYVTDLVESTHRREEHEFIELEWVNPAQMRQKINDNQILHYGSVATWGLYINRYQE